MAKAQARTNVIDEARARFEDVIGNVERDWKRLQKNADKRRKDIESRVERQLSKLRAELEKSPLVERVKELRDQAEERSERFRSELRESAAMKRVEELREQAEERFEGMLGNFGIATATDIEKLERRVNALARELKAKKQAKPAVTA